jgi:hypothetical protein
MEFERAPLPADCVPERVCEACALNAIFHRPTATAACYCAHSMTGAAMTLGGTWATVRGIEAHLFRDVLTRAVTRLELIGDVAHAIEGILIDESKRSTKH